MAIRAGIAFARHVGRGENGDDARFPGGRRNVNAYHLGVRVRRHHRPCVEELRKSIQQIAGIERFAGDMSACAFVRFRMAYKFHAATSLTLCQLLWPCMAPNRESPFLAATVTNCELFENGRRNRLPHHCKQNTFHVGADGFVCQMPFFLQNLRERGWVTPFSTWRSPMVKISGIAPQLAIRRRTFPAAIAPAPADMRHFRDDRSSGRARRRWLAEQSGHIAHPRRGR